MTSSSRNPLALAFQNLLPRAACAFLAKPKRAVAPATKSRRSIALRSHAPSLGIVERLQERLRRNTFAGDFERIVAGHHEVRVHALSAPDVSIADRLAHRVPVAAARQPADALAVSVDCLATQEDNVACRCEPREQTWQWRGALRFERRPASKRQARLQFDEMSEPRHKRGVIRADLGAPGAIALFEAKGLDRPIAGKPEPVRRARGDDRVTEGRREFDRDMQLVAEFADIGDAKGEHRRPSDHKVARGREKETPR